MLDTRAMPLVAMAVWTVAVVGTRETIALSMRSPIRCNASSSSPCPPRALLAPLHTSSNLNGDGCAAGTTTPANEQILFRAHTAGYYNYLNPAMIKASDTVVLAFAEVSFKHNLLTLDLTVSIIAHKSVTDSLQLQMIH